jgi:hypothetical protein
MSGISGQKATSVKRFGVVPLAVRFEIAPVYTDVPIGKQTRVKKEITTM